MVFLDFLKFGSFFILWKALNTVIIYYLLKRNPSSPTASALALVGV